MAAEVRDRQERIRELISLQDDDSRLRLIREEPLLRSRDAVEALQAEVVRLVYADLAEAERCVQAARSVAAETGDPYCEAISMRCSGHLHYRRAQYDDAARCYEGALAAMAALGLDREVARTQVGGMQTLIYLSRYEQALAWAGQARETFERYGDGLRLARLDSNIGNLYYRQDRYEEALLHYRRAYPGLLDMGQPQDVAAVLSNMAVCCTSLNDFTQALGYYRQAQSYCGEHGLESLIAEADYNIAYLHYLRGEYRLAMDLYQTTHRHCRATGDAYHSALCDLDEAEMYLELNLFEQGERLAEEAAVSFERLGMRYENAKALVSMAIGATDRHDIDRALRLFRRARRLFVGEGNQLWPATIDLYQAVLFHMRRSNEEARRYCKRAYRKLSRAQAGGKVALCELLQAQILRESGELEQARQIVLHTSNELQRLELRSLQFHASFLLGQIEEERAQPEDAYAAYQRARHEIETLRSRLWGEEPQVVFLKDKLSLYENLVRLRLKNPAPRALEEAFLLVEEAKSRRLADSIAIPKRPARVDGPRPDAASCVEELREQLQALYRQVERIACLPEAAQHLEALRRQVREREASLLRSIAELQAVDRESAVLLGTGSVPLESIRSALAGDSTLLQYYQIQGIIHVCLLSSRNLRIEPLAPVAQIRDILRQLRFQTAKVRLGPQYLRTYADTWRKATESHLKSLYTALIAPIRKYLRGEHLVVAPHGQLHYLPFHALLGENGHLIDEFTVSYAPSGSVYALCNSRAPSVHTESLVLGIPDANTPDIEDEVRSVAALIPKARLFVGEAATCDVLRQYAPASRIVHLATHGTFRSDNPMFSSIHLGDGHFNLTDLYQFPMAAELVTLSGCSTGLNAVVGGDELIGLMRGFLSAGARSLLVSLWEVNDRCTAEFMTSFYRSLMQQGDKACALRQAMREIRERYPHPYYWSPFILVGSVRN